MDTYLIIPENKDWQEIIEEVSTSGTSAPEPVKELEVKKYRLQS